MTNKKISSKYTQITHVKSSYTHKDNQLTSSQVNTISNLTREQPKHDLIIPTLFMMMGTLSIVSGIYAQEKKFHSVLVASYFATGPLIYALTSTFQAIERISAYIEYCTETEHKNLKKLIKPLQNVRTAIFGLLSTLTTGGAVYGIVTKKDPLPIDILSIAGAIDTIGIAGLLCKIDNLSANNSYDEKKRQQYINQLSNMTNGLFINLGLLNGAGGIYGLADAKDPVLSSISLVNGIITGIIAGKFIQLDKQRKAKQVEIIEA